MFLLHIIFQLYYSTRVNIFSKRQSLNPISTILFYLYFIVAALSLVAEAPEVPASGCKYDVGYDFFIVINIVQSVKTFKVHEAMSNA